MLRLNASPLSEPAPRALHRVRRHALQAALDRVEELLALLEELGRALARDALQLRRARYEQLGAAQLARARLGQQRELEQLADAFAFVDARRSRHRASRCER